MNLYKAVDLFCGCGGLSRGLEQAGFEVVAGLDSWKPALNVYSANNSHDAVLHDLSDEEATYEKVAAYAPSVIAGGPPCQDFSIAGAKKEGDRADLTVKFARLVARARPKAFIMENVERAQHSEAYKAATAVFKEASYGLSLRVLDASLVGVPQRRKRLFMIGMLGEADGFLDGRLDSCLKNQRKTVREALGEEIDFEHYYRHPRTYGRRAIYSVDEPSATIRGVNRPMPPTYQVHPGDAAPKEGLRAMTFQERARVQSFPKDYDWLEGSTSKSAAEQMIGNAVPVGLGLFVGQQLIAHLRSRETATQEGYLVAAE